MSSALPFIPLFFVALSLPVRALAPERRVLLRTIFRVRRHCVAANQRNCTKSPPEALLLLGFMSERSAFC
ncbi:hypothetical protein Rmet_6403 [Cupriavidus metallidurans CH34]|uniref:Uncharacterized protein n=1 Tax=Cupriavidus metallidurans (strain ATCC 43123 / DSM 2839 / NBRC 102507 / CH34) TaxID=266264 RepID=D3DXK1_CUPMC|nr:hypothetical protein Rmet_6403 [Cupriavidus metallidurans CH34]